MTAPARATVLPWLIRALPVVGLAVGAVARGWTGALVGLLAGFVVAVATSGVLAVVAPSALGAARSRPRDEAPGTSAAAAPAPVPTDQTPAPADGVRDPVPAPQAPAESADAGEAEEPDDDAVVDAALARLSAARGGVVHGRFVLEDGELQERPPTEDASLTVKTFADHRDGGTLELTRAAEAGVRATWWRGENADRLDTIPAGFVWQKNDDYYDGTVTWAELSDVRFRVRPILRWPEGAAPREVRL